ncbi:DUF547 domain-containing protein [Zunongwangia sp. F363]|uniref:DUF547 domain-containing protein n=1 Tax=Autumnicola tepida TaxID=3075595 RepID=A0ABU3C4M1_9FLAO|nr:DUF547 domain-containing protein [Zunongwangia sp. F363]MDT0641289.1 DUF547 domain-containing protein [Zunongwangia sp. F363]
MKHFTFLIFFFSAFLSAQNQAEFLNKADNFFRTYVENGKVNYAEIKENSNELKEILNLAKSFNPDPSNSDNFKAFWVNAYNLAVIDGIVKGYPVSSPLDIKGFFDEELHSLGQQSVTLDKIEHEILFDNFPSEARFHFALVCAAKSCPPLASHAYRPEKIEEQLEQQTRKTLNDPDFIKIEKNKLLLSEIFKWYKNDFTINGASLLQYINSYRENKIPEDKNIDFYDYDWGLNEL